MNASPADPRPLQVRDLRAMKRRGEKISSLTAYDASFGALIDQTGVDAILVGDSLGMVIQGHASTLPVSIADMVYHSRIVSAARRRALVIADMPFASYATQEQALDTAARLLREGSAHMVKLEGPKPGVIRFLTEQGVAVCGHLGLQPQSVHLLGGYKIQGRGETAARRILDDALLIEQAGAECLVLECVPAALGAAVAKQLEIPVIGIGAGPDCDGQVLVLYDMLGISAGAQPRFSKNFLTAAGGIAAAIRHYHEAVKTRQFPGPEHSY